MQSLRETRYFQNHVLQRLPQESLSRLQLRPVRLHSGQVLYRYDEVPRQLLFLESGVACLSIPVSRTDSGEVDMVGREGIVGLAALTKDTTNACAISMLMDGVGYCCAAAQAQQEFSRGEIFQEISLGLLQRSLRRAAHKAVCNASHSIEKRLARWLLECSLLNTSNEVSITQDALAGALKVRRSTIGMAMERLREQGAITSGRSRVVITDTHVLRAAACGCNLPELAMPPERIDGSTQGKAA